MSKEILTIKTIGLTKLNNAEYLTLMTRLGEELTKAGAATIGITQEDIDDLLANTKVFSDVFAQDRANADTALLQELDKQRDVMWQHIITAIQNAQKSPLPAEQQAAKILVPTLKPYIGKSQKPLEQETQLIRGFLLDMEKSENKPHLTTLNLPASITELNRINEEFATLFASRTIGKQEKLPNITTLRKTMDGQYNYTTQKAYATNTATPTEKSTAFILNMNSFIEEANAAYNRRSHGGKKEEGNGNNIVK